MKEPKSENEDMKSVIPGGIIAGLMFSGLWISGAEKKSGIPDLVPMPKQYNQTGGNFTVSKVPVFIAGRNRRGELGGKPGKVMSVSDTRKPGIYLLTCTHPAAKELVKRLKLKITPENPGAQGYLIASTPKQVLVIGSDDAGTLYGAMTLRQMLESGEKGEVKIAAAEVRDWPDYKFRSNISFRRGISYWATREKNPEKAYKAASDWMLRFKLNLINDYTHIHHDIREIPKSRREFIRRMNAYAVERGIYPVMWFFTNVANTYVDRGKEFKNWDCVSALNGRHCFCWSRDDLAKKRIARSVDFCKELNFKILALHSVDGGGVKDPELWSKRCPECRKRWKDSERWKASVHQLNMWADAIKKRDPGLIFTFIPYLYAASLSDYETCSDKVDKATWRLNVIEYWDKLNKHLDPMCIPQTWMATPDKMKKFCDYFKGRPVVIFGHSIRVGGYFGTWHRFNKTDFRNNPKDMFFLQGGTDRYAKFLNMICDGEYAWNVNAPGSEEFTGLFYDITRDHISPKEIIDEWVPRACRAFYGKKLGEKFAPVYQAGVLNQYIMNPGLALRSANKYRRMPLADVDPLDKDRKGLGKRAAADVEDSLAMREAQVKAVAKAMTASEAAYKDVDTLDPYRRRNFMYYYKRLPFWYLTARARVALFKSAGLIREGDYSAATALLEKALDNYNVDYKHAMAVLAKTANEPGLNTRGPLSKRDIDPRPEEIKRLLKAQLASARISLKPRRPGKYVKVAIYQGYGEKGTLNFFKQFRNVKPELIKSLSLSLLDKFDCVIMLQNMSINNKDDYFFNLRRYVAEGGGGVLFQHDMCGYERFMFGKNTPFPEIVKCGKGKKNDAGVKIMKSHPVLSGLETGKKVKYMYYDHIVLVAGKQGEVLAVDKDGEPVVAVGKVGSGKVVFDGTVNLDTKKGDVDLHGLNAVLMRGAVEWFTGVKLIKK
jgi:hypothetical protein